MRLFKRGLVHLPGGVHFPMGESGELKMLDTKLLDKSRDKIGGFPWFSLQDQMWALNYCGDCIRLEPQNIPTARFS